MSLYTTIGCDIVKIARIKKLLEKKSIYEHIFHKSELDRFEHSHLAGIFAAKEAAFKALGLQNDQWLDIEISNKINGKPMIKLATTIHNQNLVSLDVSISHEDDYAIAVVSALLKKE